MEVNNYKDIRQVWDDWGKEEKLKTVKIQSILKNIGIGIGFLMIIIGVIGLTLTLMGVFNMGNLLLLAGGLITIIECMVIFGRTLHSYLYN
jgi:hypothetical protein